VAVRYRLSEFESKKQLAMRIPYSISRKFWTW